MPDLLSRSIAFHARRQVAATGVGVVYRRGEASVELSAVRGETRFVLDNGHGAAVEIVSQDWCFPAADLVLEDAATLPRRGDTIQVVGETKTDTYEVMAPAGEQPYRLDPDRQDLRVHTKHTATTTNPEPEP